MTATNALWKTPDTNSASRYGSTTVDAGKVGLRAAERERHAEGSQLEAHVEGAPRRPESREEQLNLTGAHAAHRVAERTPREHLLEIAESVLSVRQEDEHAQVAPAIVQLYRLIPP